MFRLISFAAAVEHARLEEEQFQQAVQALPDDQKSAFITSYREAQEKRRLEAVAERRHQELCQAIRDSRLRGIGIFL